MDPKAAEVLSEIAQSTKNDLLLFMIVVSVVLILLAIPIYKMSRDDKSKDRLHNIEEQKLLIDVIQGNSKVMAELKTLLEKTNSNCVACKAEQLKKLQYLEDKQDKILDVVEKLEQVL